MMVWQPTRIILHHSATKDGLTLSWDGVGHYHRSWAYRGKIITPDRASELMAMGKRVKKPWKDNGYQAGCELVEQEYLCMIGRPWHIHGAHCRGQNTRALGFCFVGNYDEVAPDPKMIQEAVKRVLVPWCLIFQINPADIYGHCDFSNKTCPGSQFPIRDVIGQVGSKLLQIKGRG